MAGFEDFKKWLDCRHITVIGLGSSGCAASILLQSFGARVRATECNLLQDEKILALREIDIDVELGQHSREYIDSAELIVLSPGVYQDSMVVRWAREANIPIISEIELASRLCKGKIVAVTGTNGKTTVCTLISKVLQDDGRTVHLCGNIGVPFSSCIPQIKKGDFVVLEVSSFQLEWIEQFSPHIAVILNVSPDHLDRHKNLEEYLSVKAHIFRNQRQDDYLILNEQDTNIKVLSKMCRSQVRFYNQHNESVVMVVGTIFGIDEERVYRSMREFNGLPHRLEYVTTLKNIKFINDSKATNPASTMYALKRLSGGIVLIAGGKDKEMDFGVIRNHRAICNSWLRSMILIGEAKDKIYNQLKGLCPIDYAYSMEDAVIKAYKLSISGDTVLLSPMCASFDMFTNYEERGEAFKSAVSKMKNDA